MKPIYRSRFLAAISVAVLLSQWPSNPSSKLWAADQCELRPPANANEGFLKGLVRSIESRFNPVKPAVRQPIASHLLLPSQHAASRPENQAFLDQLVANPALRKQKFQGYGYRELYAGDAGVKEGYTVGQHTKMVLDTFSEQNKFYFIDRPAVPGGKRGSREFMKYVLAFHDIGKTLAVKAGDKNLQHQFTQPILKAAMKSLKFTPAEVRLADALVDNDVLGDMLKGNITSMQAAGEIQKLARRAGVNTSDFYQLQTLLYVSDAAAYPFLRQKIFGLDGGGKLVPLNPEYDNLKRLIQGSPAHFTH